MSWSYSLNPSSSPKDEVRFLVSDTNSADPLVQDEEINYAIFLVYGNTPPPNGNYLPAAYVADAIVAHFNRFADKAVGDLHISYGQRVKNYQELSTKLRMRANLESVKVFAGGQSMSDKRSQDEQPDKVQPAFKIDGMSYTRPGPGNYGPGEPNIP